MIDSKTFRILALSFPNTIELPHFEITSFRFNKKIFSTLDEKRNRACIMLTAIDQSIFVDVDKKNIYPVPNKWGQQGATYFELSGVNTTIVKEALSKAYEKIIKKN